MIKTIYLKYDNVIVNFNFKNKSAMQKIFPIATNRQPKMRLRNMVEKIASDKYSTNKYVLQFLRWEKVKGNPSELIPDTKGIRYCVGGDWVIVKMKFNVKDITDNKDLGNIEVPYIKGHDGIDKYNEIKYVEDDTEVADIYGKYHKKLYKIFHVFKKIGVMHWEKRMLMEVKNESKKDIE